MATERLRRLFLGVVVISFALGLTACFGPGDHPTTGPGAVPPGLYHLFGYEHCSVMRSGGGSVHYLQADPIFGEPSYLYYGPMYFEVKPSDVRVTNDGCFLRLADSGWDAKFRPDANGGFGNGMYRVGVEIPPGTYRTGAGPGARFCIWRRESSFDGDQSSIIQESNPFSIPSQDTVTIEPTDFGFASTACGPWTKIG